MPWGDGTGPQGLGPMTGRAAGYCAGFNAPGFANPVSRTGMGFYLGAGRGTGFYGRGVGFGRGGRFGYFGPRGGIGRGLGGWPVPNAPIVYRAPVYPSYYGYRAPYRYPAYPPGLAYGIW